MFLEKPIISKGTVSGLHIVLNIIMALIYFSWWFFPSHIGNIYLYSLLFFGETYHLLMSFLFWNLIKNSKKGIKPELKSLSKTFYNPSVDIYITVAGEEVEVVRKTVQSAKDISYTNKSIYILNDGYVAKKENWKEIENLAKKENVNCITRTVAGGAKAGNINNALKQTNGEFIAIFDADMKPYPDFLKKIVPYFTKSDVGFVQSPQYYENYDRNIITRSAWEQQEFFFGPIMVEKEKVNASFICGTNFVIRRSTIIEVGGMNEKNIAEDFLTSLSIHQRKWKSYYVAEVLAHGLAPEDLLSYYKQQLRWARGSLEVLFGQNPIFKRGLTWGQRIEYLASALFYFNGLIVLIDICMPTIFLFTGIEPVASTTTFFALFFIPFMTFNLYTLYLVSGGSLSFRAISFIQSSWFLQIRALISVITRQNMGFTVTSKKALSGNFIYLVYPHLGYIGICIAATLVAFLREGFNPSVITNIAWAGFNCAMLTPFIHSAFISTKKVKVNDAANVIYRPLIPDIQKIHSQKDYGFKPQI